jgi:hypothetical protein
MARCGMATASSLNKLVDGTASGITITGATAINDKGEILASGTVKPRGYVDLLLMPVQQRSPKR